MVLYSLSSNGGSANNLLRRMSSSRLETLALFIRVFVTVGLTIMSPRVAAASGCRVHGHGCVPRVKSETLIIETIVL